LEDRLRHKRLRLLLKNLNRQRKKQAKQIDILCNDFVTAQKDFIGKLNIIHFTADFYESIIGSTDLSTLLHTTAAWIKDEIGETNITFFLRQEDNFELHIFEAAAPDQTDSHNLENHFSPELMDGICRANRACTLEDMLAMGLQTNPSQLARLAAITLPLGTLGSSHGFILLYRSSDHKKLELADLRNLTAVKHGLSQAIAACQQLTRLTE
jgi:hypothetical protein